MNNNFYYKNIIKRSSKENIIIEKSDLKIACILDSFSYECLKYECDLIQLDTENWAGILLKEKPDLLLVESAWLGINGDWKNKIASTCNKNHTLLKTIVQLCKKLQIPTVFWNKEDPYHFEEFIEAAKLFQFIFTTDENSILKYKKILNHSYIYTLPFAAQPKVHNPIGKDIKKIGSVAFAGAWYNIGHLNRKKNMEYILKPALNYNLHIYDRNYKYNNKNYAFPEIYQPSIKGYIPYNKMAEIYKKYDIFLNVNSVNDSPSMFSRRVFELLACGTNIISSYSLGIENIFPKIVKLSKNEEDTLAHLDTLLKDKDLRDRLSLLGEREVFNNHTYTLRIESILSKVGLKYKNNNTGVCIITIVNESKDIDVVFKNYSRQLYENKQLIIILNYENADIRLWKKTAKNYNNVSIFVVHKENTLGKLLNHIIKGITLDHIAIFTTHAFYGENYLVDMMNTFKYSNADIVCKHTYYAYLKKHKLLVIIYPNFENRYIKSLSVHTAIMKKKIFNKISFPEEFHTEDLTFIRNCIKKGFLIYSSDRFNFVFIKPPSNERYTYNINNKKIFSNIEIMGYIENYLNHVIV